MSRLVTSKTFPKRGTRQQVDILGERGFFSHAEPVRLISLLLLFLRNEYIYKPIWVVSHKTTWRKVHNQGRRHEVLSRGDGDSVNQLQLPPKFIFSTDLGHFISKTRKTWYYFGNSLKKCKIVAKTAGDYPLHHVDWRGRDPLHPPPPLWRRPSS